MDETTDVDGRYVANIIGSILDSENLGKSCLLTMNI